MKQVRALLDLIKFEHAIFALPFAYLGMVLAAGGLPMFHQLFWITVAMAAARTLAMSFNRLADRHIDALNPRTAQRPIQTGKISVRTVGWDRYEAAKWLTMRRRLEANPDDKFAKDVRAKLTSEPERYAAYTREYLGWGVFALMPR